VTNAIPLPSYQWLREGLLIPGETGLVLRFNYSTASLAGTYSLIASNFSGAVTNEIATLDPPIRLSIAQGPTKIRDAVLLTAVGQNGVLEMSTNLQEWVRFITIVQPQSGCDHFQALASQRFFRFARALAAVVTPTFSGERFWPTGDWF